MLQGSFVAVVVLLVFRRSLLGYLNDQHYQEHFVYLWAFFALALSRSLKGPFRSRFGLALGRDRLGVASVGFATLLFALSSAAGASAGTRTSLVVLVVGIALLAVPRWSVRRCLMHGALMLLCFGVPYSVFMPLTSILQWGVAGAIAWPARLGLADYVVDATVVVFPHYHLVITPDCSGLGQLTTFGGIAALGVLSAAPNHRRTLGLLVLAVALAWISNLARVALFVGFVAAGATWAVDDEFWHATLGFLLFLPFIAVLVGVILRTHRPIPVGDLPSVSTGRYPIAVLVLPLLVAAVLLGMRGPSAPSDTGYFSALVEPPGHVLEMRAPSEASDRGTYETEWLINARFRRDGEHYFDLLHYTTSSRGHLCVHKIAACLYAPGQRVAYRPAVLVDGRQWWCIALDREDPSQSMHVYFAFEVGGQRRDDSYWTQLEVFRQRLLGMSWEVKLTRVILPGALPAVPTRYETELLTWIGRTTARSR